MADILQFICIMAARSCAVNSCDQKAVSSCGHVE